MQNKPEKESEWSERNTEAKKLRGTKLASQRMYEKENEELFVCEMIVYV